MALRTVLRILSRLPALTRILTCWVCVVGLNSHSVDQPSGELDVSLISDAPKTFNPPALSKRGFTWWLPRQMEELILPISAGCVVDPRDTKMMQWLRERSPWDLRELPLVGARYGDRTLAVIVPWPHYAELIVDERIAIRFSFPEGRDSASPCSVVALWCEPEPLSIARAFRDWRDSAENTGAIPRPRPLNRKAEDLPAVSRMFGAPHLYLWGSSVFSHHDVARKDWPAVARRLLDAESSTLAGRVAASFKPEQREALTALAGSERPTDAETRPVASAIADALAHPSLLRDPVGISLSSSLADNRHAFHDALGGVLREPRTWGDGLSLPLLESLHQAGIERAVLLLSDLYGKTPRPDVVGRAAELGYLLGPYDSYHSVHDPKAHPDDTWETARFDSSAYEGGRVLRRDGTGHSGFKGAGYHFSPVAAWPYVQRRVEVLLGESAYSAWFIDCDATAECFDDYHPLHSSTRLDDIRVRRERLMWLGATKNLVVGSEGGSILFADVIHFGHGVQTPYIGHIDPALKDKGSPYFLGAHWPPDMPQSSFKPVPVTPALVTPYFDPARRIPLYRSALGDEVIATHHWSFDSFKFTNVAQVRELQEILYMVPPLYHVSRASWPARSDRILRHTRFWAPLHRELAAAPLTRFEWLTQDRKLQRTTFDTPRGSVSLTANFADHPLQGHPAYSVTVSGPISVRQTVYRTDTNAEPRTP